MTTEDALWFVYLGIASKKEEIHFPPGACLCNRICLIFYDYCSHAFGPNIFLQRKLQKLTHFYVILRKSKFNWRVKKENKNFQKKKKKKTRSLLFPSAHKRALMHRLVESNPSKIEFKMEKEKVRCLLWKRGMKRHAQTGLWLKGTFV